MRPETRVALAGLGGYLLGRTRKLRWALAAGAMLATKRPFSGLKAPLRQFVESSPAASRLSEDVRSYLTVAGKNVATNMLSGRIDTVSDFLHERAEKLRGAGRAEESAERPESEQGQETEDEEEGPATRGGPGGPDSEEREGVRTATRKTVTRRD
jgi:hypothetical protein